MPWAPTQTIKTVMPFIISIIAGIIKDMALLVNSCVFIKSLLAASKRSSSCFSLLKARITGIPVRISLATRFSRSTSFCIILNFAISTITRQKMVPTATAIIQVIEVFVCSTLIMPPIPMMGAYATILRSITVTIWIC